MIDVKKRKLLQTLDFLESLLDIIELHIIPIPTDFYNKLEYVYLKSSK